MYLVREVMYCQPGKVREMVEKFKELSHVMVEMGHTAARIYTDVSGERFWTVVFQNETESLDAFREMEAEVMSNDKAREAMAGYHDLIVEGRREIFTVEA